MSQRGGSGGPTGSGGVGQASSGAYTSFAHGQQRSQHGDRAAQGFPDARYAPDMSGQPSVPEGWLPQAPVYGHSGYGAPGQMYGGAFVGPSYGYGPQYPPPPLPQLPLQHQSHLPNLHIHTSVSPQINTPSSQMSPSAPLSSIPTSPTTNMRGLYPGRQLVQQQQQRTSLGIDIYGLPGDSGQDLDEESPFLQVLEPDWLERRIEHCVARNKASLERTTEEPDEDISDGAEESSGRLKKMGQTVRTLQVQLAEEQGRTTALSDAVGLLVGVVSDLRQDRRELQQRLVLIEKQKEFDSARSVVVKAKDHTALKVSDCVLQAI